MKWCTRIAVTDAGMIASVLDISMVDDDHEFGLNADGTELHIEAQEKPVDNDDPAA